MKILIVDDIKGWRDYHANFVNELFPESEILFAESAKDGYEMLMEHNDNPFNIILTDMQMEEDFYPKYAGEWFVEQIKTFKNYNNTKIFIISAAYNIEQIAKFLNVKYIRKATARSFPDIYSELKS